MAYQLTKLTDVQPSPSHAGERFGRQFSGRVFFGTGKKFEDADTRERWVNILIPPGLLDGWIPEDHCVEVPDPEPYPVDEESFVRQCILVDRSFNNLESTSPFFVSADFLIARALIETDLKYSPPDVGSDAVGPLRVTAAEWNDFLNNGKPFSDDYDASDRVYPMIQVYAAGFRMYDDGKTFSGKMKDVDAVSEADGPFVPSYLDLFHAILVDLDFAKQIRSFETDGSKKLSDISNSAQISAINKRQKLNSVSGATTVSSFVRKTEEVLNAALADAFKLMEKFASEELPQVKTGKARWFDVAQQEKASSVSEAKTPKKIKEYFDSTDYGKVGPNAAIPNWCGAFAAYCVNEGGYKDTIPKGSARAARWKGWGQQGIPIGSNDIPIGAVVVLTPSLGTNTSGHVGFFAGFPAGGKHITLLGGNQKDSVNETAFLRSRIAAIRWLETAPSSKGAATAKFNLTAAGVKTQFQKFGDLIVDRFQRGGFTSDRHLKAALANAIAESGLDPSAVAKPPEQSFGLFQCNRTHGLGKGFTIDQLKDPNINIGIIIRECKKSDQFRLASTLEDAVDAFVTFIERPLDKAAAIAKRTAIAKKL